VTVAKKSSNVNQPWYIAGLIAGIDATPTLRYFLTLIQRHTNSRKGFAWASQETLAHEMGVHVSTVERAFQWAKRIGIVGVRRIRTGKGKEDQYNEYWLNVERLKELQRPAKHPASTPGGTDKHPASATGASKAEHPASGTSSTPHLATEHPANGTSSTPHLAAEHPANGGRAPRTHAGEGFEVKQVEGTSLREFEVKQNLNNSYSEQGAVSSLRSPEIPPGLSHEIETAKQELVDRFVFMLGYEKIEKGNDLRINTWFDLFRKDANALSTEWNEIQILWRRVLQSVFPAPVQPKPEPAPPPKPQPKPESVPGFNVATADRGTVWKRSRAFYAYAHKFGWTPLKNEYERSKILEYLKATFSVKTPDKLTPEQFTIAWRRLEQGPPKPN
jgi:hypothetical protein